MFVLAQILGIINLVIYALAVQIKDKTKCMLVLALDNLFVLASYYCLNAKIGMVIGTIATIRMFVFYFMELKNKQSWIVLLIFEIAIIIGSIYTWQGWISIVVVLGYVIYTYGAWQKEKRVLLITSFASNGSLFTYNLIVRGYANALKAVTIMVADSIALARMKKKK